MKKKISVSNIVIFSSSIVVGIIGLILTFLPEKQYVTMPNREE